MLNAISQKLHHMEYGINKIGTFIVLVPGVSWVTYTLKTAALHQKIKDDQAQEPNLALMEEKDWKQLKQTNQWHILGSLVQTIVIVALAILKQRHLLALAAVVPVCELLSALRSSQYEGEEIRRGALKG